MIKEIGGNLPIEESLLALNANNSEIYGCSKFAYNIYTFSGRSALKILLKCNYNGPKKVLLPCYTCVTCIAPFFENDFEIEYYLINEDLTIDIDDLNKKLVKFNFECMVYVQSYFGFDTLKSSREYLEKIKSANNNLKIVYDYTHSWLQNPKLVSADYYISSLRKWLSTPDGGVLSSDIVLKNSLEISSYSKNQIEGYVEASKLKNRYLNGDITVKKEDFYPLFKNVITYFRSPKINELSPISKVVFENTDYNDVIYKRRRNSKYLCENIDNKFVKKIFNQISECDVPFYYPVYIEETKRKDFQSYLAKNDIFCPIHWSVPEYLNNRDERNSIYPNIISLVCDQRYGLDDMKRFVEVINNYDK